MVPHEHRLSTELIKALRKLLDLYQGLWHTLWAYLCCWKLADEAAPILDRAREPVREVAEDRIDERALKVKARCMLDETMNSSGNEKGERGETIYSVSWQGEKKLSNMNISS